MFIYNFLHPSIWKNTKYVEKYNQVYEKNITKYVKRVNVNNHSKHNYSPLRGSYTLLFSIN